MVFLENRHNRRSLKYHEHNLDRGAKHRVAAILGGPVPLNAFNSGEVIDPWSKDDAVVAVVEPKGQSSTSLEFRFLLSSQTALTPI